MNLKLLLSQLQLHYELLNHAVAMLGIEIAKGHTGFNASCILVVFFAEAIRAYGATDDAAQSGWFRALDDPKIGRVLSHIHEAAGTPWTTAALAKTIALSASRDLAPAS